MRKPRFWRFGGIRISRRAVQRATLWVTLVAQVSVGLPIDVLARAREQQRATAAAQSPPASHGLAQPQPQSAPAPVHVNRTVPKVTPAGARPTFSVEPSDAEISNARIFGEPLIAIGRGTLRGENHALADAVTRYLDAHNPENVLPFLGFLKTYPDSPWRASLLLNLGLVYRHTGYFLRALDVWEQTWLATKTNTDAKARAVADRAVGELFALNARLGRFERLEALFAETKDRVVTGPATEQITAAREGLWMMRNTPEKAFLCGPLAVDQVLAASRAGYVRDEKILQAKSTQQGTSLAQMQKLAADLNLPLQMAKRAPGAPVLLPAVMHWKAGHFAALIREADGKFLVRDPTFGDELWVSRAALDEEATGYMLVKPQTWPDGWHAVEQTEGEQVWGKGQTDGNDPDQTHNDDEQAGGDGGGPGDGPSDGDGNDPDADNPDNDPDHNNPDQDDPDDNDPDDADPDDPSCDGMPRYSMHLMVAGLHLKDTPINHTVPRGPSPAFTVTYNQREAHQPTGFTFSNLGPKWQFTWLSYIEDDPTNANATAYLAARGGGRDVFQNFNPATQSYQADKHAHAVLTRTSSSPIRYERRLTNGGVEVFAQPDGAVTMPRRVFLTEIRDPQGNSLTFTYDAQLRLVAATDAIGQVTTLSYDDAADTRRITRVTDPFGRFATFDYDGAGRLAHITDVLGLQSGFTYDAGDFITALTTPYGTTRFVKGENGQDRWLEATDPLGAKERVEYKMNAPIPATDPATQVPANLGFVNNYLNYRNTFFWNKRAMALAPRDPMSAHRYHWLHTSGPLNQTSGVLESEQRPLEGRIWYRYPGQTASYAEGTTRRRSVHARVLDDGTTAAWQYEYNDQNHLTKRTDPLGRVTSYTYAANGIDVLEVRQTTGGLNDLLATYGNYTSLHRAQTLTDTAGQTTTRTYNAYGQLLTLTNPKSETTTFAYDTGGNGYLQSKSVTTSGATVSYAYDSYGRVHTVTGPDGYTLTLDHDAMNRRTRVTYPDSTFDQVTYDRLDIAEQRDRAGRITEAFHDALRRLTAVRDPQGRTTLLQWCVCGTLDALTDSKGQKTSWERDLQGRQTRELRADGTSATNYVYETTTSRLQSVTDPKLQVTTFGYNADNSLHTLVYTNAQATTPSVTYAYDTAYGRRVSMTDGNGLTSYTYKPVGVLGGGQVDAIDGPLANDTITYTYDELGRISGRLVNGVGATQTFDGLGRVTSELNPLGTFAYGYDGGTGRLASVTYPSGQTATLSYFGGLNDRRVQTIHHKRPNGATLSRFDYTYDNVGNVATWQQQTDSAQPVLWTYAYNSADELLTAVKQSTDAVPVMLKRYAYSYDAAGNRLSEQNDEAITSWAYDTRNRPTGQQGGGPLRVAGTVSEPATVTIQGVPATVAANNQFAGMATMASGTNTLTIVATDASGNSHTQAYHVDVTGQSGTLDHDANGNTISDGSVTYHWDAADRLVEITDGNRHVVRAYDGDGFLKRQTETLSGNIVEDLWMIWCDGRLCETRDAGGGEIKRFFQQGTTSTTNGNVLIASDHLGSPTDLTDASGNRLAAYAYSPWGAREQLAGSATLERAFTGHRNIGSFTNLLDTPARVYDVMRGRFLGEDSVPREVNLFRYANNNPLAYVDRNGRNPLAGVLAGAEVGSLGGPIGTVAGGIVGGLIGLWVGQKIWDAIADDVAPLQGKMCPTHRNNRRGSNWDKHSGRRSGDDEDGDARRRPPRNRPPNYPKKGPWPPDPDYWRRWKGYK